MQKLPETERKRNCLCIRWDDAQHQIVANEAYKKRTSCSELVRSIVLEQLKTKGETEPLPKTI